MNQIRHMVEYGAWVKNIKTGVYELMAQTLTSEDMCKKRAKAKIDEINRKSPDTYSDIVIKKRRLISYVGDWTESEKDLDVFPKRLRYLREQAGLSVSDLASKAGISPKTITLYENNERKASYENLMKIVNVLGCTTLELLTEYK